VRTAIFGDEDYKAPADKAEAKKAETDAIAKLKADKKNELAAADKRLAQFKTNFADLVKFTKDELEANFDELTFYIPGEGATLGSCMLIPARYIGEAVTPSFYFFADGILENKF
jgi:hypothetical protein